MSYIPYGYLDGEEVVVMDAIEVEVTDTITAIPIEVIDTIDTIEVTVLPVDTGTIPVEVDP